MYDIAFLDSSFEECIEAVLQRFYIDTDEICLEPGIGLLIQKIWRRGNYYPAWKLAGQCKGGKLVFYRREMQYLIQHFMKC